MVPIDTLKSKFDEPSSGSCSTAYLPGLNCSGIGNGSSSSSDAMTHTLPVQLIICFMVSLAMTSSFCCLSPYTFVPLAAPSMSTKPARRTYPEMILEASAMS